LTEEQLPRAFGSFLLLDRLAAGGMGTLHLARPMRSRENVPILVIKRLHPGVAEHPDVLARFRHEAEIAVSVQSEHVVRVFDVGTVGLAPFIAMEHVLGSTLGALLGACTKAQHALPLPILSRIFTDALEGLESLHEAVHPETGAPLGAVHRDISPGNLMIAADRGRSVLIDLGLGRSNVQKWRTQTGATMGTPGYMAPEQARGERTDPRTDVYSLGVLLWEALTHEHYITRGELADMVARMSNPQPRWLASRTGAPDALDAVVRRALSPDPSQRFETAREFRTALIAAAPPAPEHEVIAALPPSIRESWKDKQRRIDRLLDASFEADEEPGTTIYATRVGITMPMATEKLEHRRFPWGAVAASFAGVVVAAALGTWIAIEPDPVEIKPIDLPPEIAPRPEVTARKIEPPPPPQPPPSNPVPVRVPVRVPIPTKPSPPAKLETPKVDLKSLAKTAAQAKKAHPSDPHLSELITRINRLLLLPSLDDHQPELRQISDELERYR
jgi:eukaryotic-like serine/threonine-protein kinase